MQRWSNFQKSAIVPAFRELRARNIFATVQRLACCQSCAHGDLSQQHTSYLFFHVQDEDCCIETPTSQPLKLYLGFDFESVDVQARALAILKKHCRVDWNGDHGTRTHLRVCPIIKTTTALANREHALPPKWFTPEPPFTVWPLIQV